MLLDDATRVTLAGRLDDFERLDPAGDGATEAAVALAVVGVPGGPAGLVVLERGHVGSHRGQYGLPGGRVDAGESAVEASLRELTEEVGIEASETDVLGELDPLTTRSGFRMRPFVVWCPDSSPVVASPREVAAVHVVTLATLTLPDAVHHTHVPETGRPTVQVDVGFTTIFAPTGAILHQFRALALDGRTVRVQDLDAPRFTWR